MPHEGAAQYQEAIISFPFCEDLYLAHKKVLAVTGRYPGIVYSRVGVAGNFDGAILRAMPGVSFPDRIVGAAHTLTDGATLLARGGFRMIQRTNTGYQMPEPDEAMRQWIALLTVGGFSADAGNTVMAEESLSFFYPDQDRDIVLPFWKVTSKLIVTDAEKAAAAMVRGIGRNLWLGFGMIILS